MLQKFVRLFFAALIFWTFSAKAVVFSAPDANTESFQKFALAENQQTYTQRMQQKINDSSVEAHPQVLEFSRTALATASPKTLLKEWERLRQSIELNATDREILVLLAEKLNLKKEVCRYLLLDSGLKEILPNPDKFESCHRDPSLHNLKPLADADILVIDGKAYTSSQLPKKILPGTYRWKMLSNKYEDRDFVGTVPEFAKKKFPKTPWVEGSEKNYKLRYEDLALSRQSQIFFSKEVQKPGIPPEKTFSTWASEHKILLWGVGIIAAGLAAQQLKDKTLIFTRP